MKTRKIAAKLILLVILFALIFPSSVLAERGGNDWRTMSPGDAYNVLARDAFAVEKYSLAYDYAMKSVKLYQRKHGRCGESYIIAARSAYWLGKPNEGQQLLYQAREALLYSGQVQSSTGSKSASVALYEESFTETLKHWKPVGMQVPPDSEIIQLPGLPAIFRHQLVQYYNQYKDQYIKRAGVNPMLVKILDSLDSVVKPILAEIEKGNPIPEQKAAAATAAVSGLLMIFNLIETIVPVAASRAKARTEAGGSIGTGLNTVKGAVLETGEKGGAAGTIVTNSAAGVDMSGDMDGGDANIVVSVAEDSKFTNAGAHDGILISPDGSDDLMGTDQVEGVLISTDGSDDLMSKVKDHGPIVSTEGDPSKIALSEAEGDSDGFEKPPGFDMTSSLFGVAQDHLKDLKNSLGNHFAGGDLIDAANKVQDLKNNVLVAGQNADEAAARFANALKNDTHVGMSGDIVAGNQGDFDKAVQDMLEANKAESNAVKDLAGAESSFKSGNMIKNVGGKILDVADKSMTGADFVFNSMKNMLPTVTDNGVLIEGDDWYYAMGKAAETSAINAELGVANPSLGLMDLTNSLLFGDSRAGDMISPSGNISGFFNYVTDSLVDCANGTNNADLRLNMGKDGYGENLKNFIDLKNMAGEAMNDPSKFTDEVGEVTTNDGFYTDMQDTANDIFKTKADAGIVKQGASWFGTNVTNGLVEIAKGLKDTSQYAGGSSFSDMVDDAPDILSSA